MKLLSIANLFEAVLWVGFAATFTSLAWRSTGRQRRLWAILAVAFLAFGFSDVIESQTGAWWRPLWLLALKSACIATFLYGVWEYRRTQVAQRAHEAASEVRQIENSTGD